jgi:prephenate dehydrogenase/acetolactate synthase regulatory subunit
MRNVIEHQAEILILATPIDQIAATIEQIRNHLDGTKILVDVASLKRDFRLMLDDVAHETDVSAASTHPMTKPDLPSLRGQNALIMPVGDGAEGATQFATDLFSHLEMRIHNIALDVHDTLMLILQSVPHLVGQMLCHIFADFCHAHGISMRELHELGSPHSHLMELAFGRTMTVDANLSAGLIMQGEGGESPAFRMVQSALDAMRAAAKGNTLPATIAEHRQHLDPDKSWLQRMRRTTDTILVRLGNLRMCSLRIEADHDRPGLLGDILNVFRHHGFDLNAIDSLPSTRHALGVHFEIGVKSQPIDWELLQSDLSSLGVIVEQSTDSQ